MNLLFFLSGILVIEKIVNLILDVVSEEDTQKKARFEEEKISLQKELEAASESEREDLLETFRAKVIGAAEERITAYEELRTDIDKTLRSIEESLGQHAITPLRRNSLYTLQRQITEVKYKNISYIQYLKHYVKSLGDAGKSVDIFDYRLPDDYPYFGKIVWLRSENIDEDTFVDIVSDQRICVNYRIKDYSLVARSAQNPFPVMVTSITARSSNTYLCSYEYGHFIEYEMSNSCLGIDACVTKFHRDYIELTHGTSIKLKLKYNQLISANRCPPVRATRTVYPLYWKYALMPFGKEEFNMSVSEKNTDMLTDLRFDVLPIKIDNTGLDDLLDFISDRRLNNSYAEWFIGPVNDGMDNELFKLQLGNHNICYLNLGSYSDKDVEHICFEFKGLCDDNVPLFSSDDIFIPINASIAPCFFGIDEETLKNEVGIKELGIYDNFIIRVLEEFSVQRRINQNRHGMAYFDKWIELYDRLIRSNKDESVRIKVDWHYTDPLTAYIIDMSDLYELMDRKYDDVTGFAFYIKSANGYKYDVEIEPNKLLLKHSIKRKDIIAELCIKDMVEVFLCENTYIERQLMRSLKELRVGNVVNPQLLLACLNSSAIQSEKNENHVISSFNNKMLSSDASQNNAVREAFGERNIYAIQGPPGTGKTTVIRELVYQQMQIKPNSKILIASQSNAAVDNALEGLLEDYSSDIIRCGSTKKISDKLLRFAIDEKCDEYIKSICNLSDSDSESAAEWRRILSKGDGEYNSFLKELLIRNHRIVGATCMGLMKRSIGLDHMHFDLVIVDEAVKALPAELTIPTLRAEKIVYIGDQNQLPPVIDQRVFDIEETTFGNSNYSSKLLFDKSLFERIIEDLPDSNKALLSTQYRMPSVIGTIVSQLFYNGKIKNGKNTENKKPVFHETNLVFYDFEKMKSYHELREDNSVVNNVEVQFVTALIANIKEHNPECTMAVITPYRGQKRKLIDALRDYCYTNIKIDTVDGFQGQEAEIVIFCTTRAKRKTAFFKDSRRINVAISRTKNELIILGKLSYFDSYSLSNSCLPRLAEYIRNKGEIRNVLDP